jgi:hypothetical protein
MPAQEIDLLSPRTWTKHFSLVPVVGICAGACALASGYIAYMCVTKPDFTFRPWQWHSNAPYQNIKPTEVRRLMAYTREITLDNEMIALRKELADTYYNPK